MTDFIDSVYRPHDRPHGRRVPLVFDLETEPDLPWLDRTGREFADALDPPANYKKAESIEKWIAERAAERVAKASVSPIDGRITAFAVAPLWSDAKPVAIANRVSESTLIRDLIVEIRRLVRDGEPILAGYNVRTFDLPFLAARAAVHQITLPAWWPDLTRSWGSCIDAYDILGREGKLELWLARFGLPSKTGSGALVSGMTDDVLEAYVANDVAVERALLQRLALVSPVLRQTQPDLVPDFVPTP